METIVLNGVEYVKKEDAMANVANATSTDGLEYCIIRTCSAGVHAGYVESRNGEEVVLRYSRRLWRWAGAFTLSLPPRGAWIEMISISYHLPFQP